MTREERGGEGRRGGEDGSPCERMTGGQRREEDVSLVWYSWSGHKTRRHFFQDSSH